MSRSYSSLLAWFALAIAASLMLYHTSDRVNALGQKMRGLDQQIEAERQSLHVLQAEWVYLANPARIEAGARRHLNLLPTATARVAAMKDIGNLLPLRDGVEPAPLVAVAEAASGKVVAEKVVAAPRADMSAASLDARQPDAGHLGDRMVMRPTAQIASTDSIGALIGSLSLRP